VLGTGNRTERLLGYFTKYGDGAADISPIAGLYKTEVRELARHIGVPEKFIYKTPTAGLWEGQTDEEDLGAGYETLDEVLKLLVDDVSINKIVRKTGAERELVENIEEMRENSAHKRAPSPFPRF
jgi:NAD+ synthase